MDRYTALILRLSLGSILLWFSVHQFLDPVTWSSYVPAWALPFLFTSVENIVRLNATVELVLGVLLLLGLFRKWTNLLTILHMIIIVIGVGYNEIGVRDFGLLMAAVALATIKDDTYSLDCVLAARA